MSSSTNTIYLATESTSVTLPTYSQTTVTSDITSVSTNTVYPAAESTSSILPKYSSTTTDTSVIISSSTNIYPSTESTSAILPTYSQTRVKSDITRSSTNIIYPTTESASANIPTHSSTSTVTSDITSSSTITIYQTTDSTIDILPTYSQSTVTSDITSSSTINIYQTTDGTIAILPIYSQSTVTSDIASTSTNTIYLATESTTVILPTYSQTAVTSDVTSSSTITIYPTTESTNAILPTYSQTPVTSDTIIASAINIYPTTKSTDASLPTYSQTTVTSDITISSTINIYPTTESTSPILPTYIQTSFTSDISSLSTNNMYPTTESTGARLTTYSQSTLAADTTISPTNTVFPKTESSSASLLTDSETTVTSDTSYLSAVTVYPTTAESTSDSLPTYSQTTDTSDTTISPTNTVFPTTESTGVVSSSSPVPPAPSVNCVTPSAAAIGKMFTLECVVERLVNLSRVEFLRDDQSVGYLDLMYEPLTSGDGRLSINVSHQGDGAVKAVLTFAPVSCGDAGVYKCIAENEAETVQAEVRLTIQREPQTPALNVPKIVESFTMTPPDCQANIGYNSDVVFRWLLRRPNGTEQVLEDRQGQDTVSVNDTTCTTMGSSHLQPHQYIGWNNSELCCQLTQSTNNSLVVTQVCETLRLIPVDYCSSTNASYLLYPFEPCYTYIQCSGPYIYFSYCPRSAKNCFDINAIACSLPDTSTAVSSTTTALSTYITSSQEASTALMVTATSENAPTGSDVAMTSSEATRQPSLSVACTAPILAAIDSSFTLRCSITRASNLSEVGFTRDGLVISSLNVTSGISIPGSQQVSIGGVYVDDVFNVDLIFANVTCGDGGSYIFFARDNTNSAQTAVVVKVKREPGTPVLTIPRIVESVTADQPECQANIGYNSDVTFTWLLRRPNGTVEVLSNRQTDTNSANDTACTTSGKSVLQAQRYIGWNNSELCCQLTQSDDTSLVMSQVCKTVKLVPADYCSSTNSSYLIYPYDSCHIYIRCVGSFIYIVDCPAGLCFNADQNICTW